MNIFKETRIQTSKETVAYSLACCTKTGNAQRRGRGVSLDLTFLMRRRRRYLDLHCSKQNPSLCYLSFLKKHAILHACICKVCIYTGRVHKRAYPFLFHLSCVRGPFQIHCPDSNINKCIKQEDTTQNHSHTHTQTHRNVNPRTSARTQKIHRGTGNYIQNKHHNQNKMHIYFLTQKQNSPAYITPNISSSPPSSLPRFVGCVELPAAASRTAERDGLSCRYAQGLSAR